MVEIHSGTALKTSAGMPLPSLSQLQMREKVGCREVPQESVFRGGEGARGGSGVMIRRPQDSVGLAVGTETRA